MHHKSNINSNSSETKLSEIYISKRAAQFRVHRRQADAECLVASQWVSTKEISSRQKKRYQDEQLLRVITGLPKVHYVLGLANPTKLQDSLPSVLLSIITSW